MDVQVHCRAVVPRPAVGESDYGAGRAGRTTPACSRRSSISHSILTPQSITWLPVGVHRTYGFRSASEVFTKTSNATGFGFGWAWALSFF